MIDPRVELLLALADDELIIGHRHSHWTGVAPHIEEDLAFSSISQDEIGHAVVWYRLAAEVAGEQGVRDLATRAPAGGDHADALGLGREANGYRNAVLVERPNGDWGYSLARHYLYDVAEDVRLTTLAGSSWRAAADATGALRREERYHLLHARTWLDRLANGPLDARIHLADGLVAALAEAPGLFEPLPGEAELVADGVLPDDHATQQQRWLEAVTADLEAVGMDHVLGGDPHHGEGEFLATASGELVARDGARAPSGSGDGGYGGRLGRHSSDFDAVWEEMTGTYRAYPGVRW
ncbi:MAG: phenylacetate-CoA oxygenase subunit PaaC [Actinomycetota bacterium]|nr:phenylacetate-CoA oxygenase subunit PaaC [Actinomycetota bacterium]